MNKLKQLAIKLGLWEEYEYVTYITQEEVDFLLKAKERYCEQCDIFMKDLRSIRGHMRLKHQGGMRANITYEKENN